MFVMVQLRRKHRGKAACVGTLIACGYLAWKYFAYRRLLIKIAARRNEKEEKMRKLHIKLHINKQQRDDILKLKPEEIVQAAKDGEWKSSDIVKIFLHEAYKILAYNCLTSIIPRALNDAHTLDDIENNEDMKLYGLPVSFVDNIATKGLGCTLGLTSLMDQPAEVDDGVIVKVLRHCGAVPFLKTNISQQMISFTSSNPVYGEVLHPARPEFAPGGSSSGEGPMLAFRYSALGIGADLVGGIRAPAHLCGIAALKPTVNRLSVAGLKGTMPGGLILRATIGPMAKDVNTLVLAMRALLCPLMFELDPNVPPIPFNEEMFNSTKKLRIGYYIDDGYNKPITAIKRGVLLAKNALVKAGHVLVPFKVPKIEEAMEIITAALFSDGGQIYLNELRGSLEEPRLGNLYSKLRCPYAIRRVKTYLLGFKWPRLAKDLDLHGGGDRSVSRLWNLEARANVYKKEFSDSWKKARLDAIICPPFPIVSGPFEHFENLTALMSYTALYSLLDYPAGVVPKTKVTQADVDALKYFKGHYGDPWDENLREACKDSVGMPVGVQCVAQPWQEELCLRVMREIQRQPR